MQCSYFLSILCPMILLWVKPTGFLYFYYYFSKQKNSCFQLLFFCIFKTTYMWHSLRIFLPCVLIYSSGHLVTSSLSVICFANIQSNSWSLFHMQACSDRSFLVLTACLSLIGQALDRLVTVSSIHYCTSTSALSTSSSSRGLTSFEWDISSWGGLHA